jgi:drug/metabolite transporter (DMT)-like permease
MRKIKGSLTLKIFILIVMTDVIESVAELFFKKGALVTGINNVTLANAWLFLCRIVAAPSLWAGVLLYIANFFLWIIVLSKIDLSVAFPVGSTTYIIVPLLSIIFLHEKVALMRWIGIVLIIIGVLFVTKSTKIGKVHEP